jgi:hemerythrin
VQEISWDPAYETGVDAIDDDHRELFELVAALFNAVGGPSSATAEAADRLIRQLAEHFAREERLMDETNFPEARIHKRTHAVLLRQFGTVRSGLDAELPWLAGTLALLTNDLLFRHVEQLDKPLAAHVLSTRKKC